MLSPISLLTMFNSFPVFLNTQNVVIVTVLTCRFAHSNKCIASELAPVVPLSPLCGSCLLVVLYIWSFFFLDAAIVNFALLGTEYFHISINNLELSLGGC